MKASEARKITGSNLKGPVIEPYLEYIYARIKKAAEEGKGNIAHPFSGMRPYPCLEEQAAIFQQLRAEGYKVTHHKNPDPGDPRSSDYDEISW